MVAWAVKDFGGEIPRRDARNLPDGMAEAAWNCDLASGPLDALPIPELVKDLTAVVGTVRRAYRLPGPNVGDPDVWLPLPSEYSSVVRSPLANDTAHRIYWTNPSDGPYWNTYARIAAASAAYNLGTVQPDLSIVIVGHVAGGAATSISRSYCFTYVNEYGEESAPSTPSAVVSGPSDGTWTVTGLPALAPGNPVGKNYPVITKMNLYRTSTGTNTGAQFYLVKTFVYGSTPPTDPYTDAVTDAAAVQNQPLITASWANPPAGLDGLTALPGGMLVGFTTNTVHFCEPNRPHAWPAGYDQSLHYDIVGLGVWQQSLMVLTKGFPASGSGNSPANFVFTEIRVPEPCLSRGSIVVDLMGVYYASQNGLVMLNYFGMQNQTLSNFTREQWLTTFSAATIIACRHRAQYLAITGTGVGFIIDYTEARMGVCQVNTFNAATCVWNDEYNGDTYVISAKQVYRWDSTSTGPLNYRWRSKQFYGPKPVNLGACQVALDAAVLDPPPDPNPTPPLDNGDSSLVLPAGINAVFRLYAGLDGSGGLTLVFSRNLSQPREIFRLPSGFKAFDWQFELLARVPVHSVELATTMEELKGV